MLFALISHCSTIPDKRHTWDGIENTLISDGCKTL